MTSDLVDFSIFKDKDIAICPITKMPIKTFAITLVGSVYEKDAISDWFKNNNIDPLTGIELSRKKLLIDGITKDNYKKQSKKIRRENLYFWVKNDYKYKDKIEWNEIKRISKNISKFRNEELMEWNEYNRYKITTLFDKEIIKSFFCFNFKNLDEQDKIKRPEDTGEGYEFIDFKEGEYKNLVFKSTSFNGANLSGTCFKNCDFSRCTFIGTNIDKTIFVECQFIGEETSFYKAFGDQVIFKNCIVEYTSFWITTTNTEEIQDILKKRLLTVDACVMKV